MNDELKKAINNEKVQKAINNLDQKQKDKLNTIMSDEKELERIMKTPQAQMLLKKLMEQ